MRRLATATTLASLAAGLVLLLATAGESSTYRVAAIFDSAKGIVGGQQVKIAGAVVGSVEEVELAPGPKARMVLSVDSEFEPFHEDASCKIAPEGLISENFIDCDPGTSGGGSLPRGQDGLPELAVEQTAAPVTLQDLIRAFAAPTNDRLRIIVNELGIATAGRGTDLNALLRRANPALTQSRRVLSIIDGQRAELARAVAQTDRVISELARRDDDVRRFVDRGAALAETTAEQRQPLGAAVRRLPALLDAARPGLLALDRAAIKASPLLDQLRASAPGLRSVVGTLPRFTSLGAPAFGRLGSAAAQGRAAIPALRPVVDRLRSTVGPLEPFARDLDELLVNTRDRGGIEGLMKSLYAFASSLGSYDSVSHYIGVHLLTAPQCIAGAQVDADVEGCDTRYLAPGQGTVPLNKPDCGPQNTPESTADWFGTYCGDGFPPFAPTSKKARRDRDRAAGADDEGSDGASDAGERRAEPKADEEPSPDEREELLDFLFK